MAAPLVPAHVPKKMAAAAFGRQPFTTEGAEVGGSLMAVRRQSELGGRLAGSDTLIQQAATCGGAMSVHRLGRHGT